MTDKNELLIQAARDILFPNGDLNHPCGSEELGELVSLFHPEIETREPDVVMETITKSIDLARCEDMMGRWKREFPKMSDYFNKYPVCKTAEAEGTTVYKDLTADVATDVAEVRGLMLEIREIQEDNTLSEDEYNKSEHLASLAVDLACNVSLDKLLDLILRATGVVYALQRENAVLRKGTTVERVTEYLARAEEIRNSTSYGGSYDEEQIAELTRMVESLTRENDRLRTGMMIEGDYVMSGEPHPDEVVDATVTEKGRAYLDVDYAGLEMQIVEGLGVSLDQMGEHPMHAYEAAVKEENTRVFGEAVDKITGRNRDH